MTIMTKIKGYRELDTATLELINKIKLHEKVTLELVQEIRDHIVDQRNVALHMSSIEMTRLNAAEPERWTSIGRTDLQTAFMALVRAVAQPGEA